VCVYIYIYVCVCVCVCACVCVHRMVTYQQAWATDVIGRIIQRRREVSGMRWRQCVMRWLKRPSSVD